MVCKTNPLCLIDYARQKLDMIRSSVLGVVRTPNCMVRRNDRTLLVNLKNLAIAGSGSYMHTFKINWYRH